MQYCFPMDSRFCKHFQNPEIKLERPYQYCRSCPTADRACDKLWQMVVDLSNSNGGNDVPLPHTTKLIFPNTTTWEIVYLRKNAEMKTTHPKTFWRLNKEDFLYFISTGYAEPGFKEQREDPLVAPTMTRHTNTCQVIIEAIGGNDIPEIIAVRRIQHC